MYGGVERIIESLAAGLPQRGIDVVVGLAKGQRFHDPDRYRAEYPTLDTIDIDDSTGRPAGRVAAVQRAITRVDPDLVLIARLFDAYHAAAVLKQRRHRLRLAVTIQAYEPDYLVDAAHYAGHIDLCVTSGRLIADAVERFASVAVQRVVSIPGGVAPPRHPHTPSPTLRLGYAGRIETQQKRALDLADLLDELQRRGVAFTCTIAGSGSAEAQLRERVAPFGDRVTMRGWLSTEGLYESVYPNLDVILHFAEWEGITIAPREAMAHGAVPVVSRFIGLKTEGQFVDDVNSLTFPVGDVAAAADAVTRLDRDRALLARLSNAAAVSQTGIRSHEGAVDAWAAAFTRTLERPARTDSALPPLRRQRGRLSKLPVPVAEFARRLLRRRLTHNDPGSEWPHWSGEHDAAMEAAIAEFARHAE